MNANILTAKEQDTEEHWISISDMMAGLMVIFLFIAISYMLHVQADKEKIEQIAVTYRNCSPIYTLTLRKNLKTTSINGTLF